MRVRALVGTPGGCGDGCDLQRVRQEAWAYGLALWPAGGVIVNVSAIRERAVTEPGQVSWLV